MLVGADRAENSLSDEGEDEVEELIQDMCDEQEHKEQGSNLAY